MSGIATTDPIALRYLMTETIFDSDEQGEPARLRVPLFAFYGKNKRNYLFLTEERQHEWMSAPALDAFVKTLGALKLTTEDIALLNLAAFDTLPAQEDMLSFFHPRVVVSLGVVLPWIAQHSSPTEVVTDYNGIAIFRTVTFDEMLVDAEKKRGFWTIIKTLLT